VIITFKDTFFQLEQPVQNLKLVTSTLANQTKCSWSFSFPGNWFFDFSDFLCQNFAPNFPQQNIDHFDFGKILLPTFLFIYFNFAPILNPPIGSFILAKATKTCLTSAVDVNALATLVVQHKQYSFCSCHTT